VLSNPTASGTIELPCLGCTTRGQATPRPAVYTTGLLSVAGRECPPSQHQVSTSRGAGFESVSSLFTTEAPARVPPNLVADSGTGEPRIPFPPEPFHFATRRTPSPVRAPVPVGETSSTPRLAMSPRHSRAGHGHGQVKRLLSELPFASPWTPGCMACPDVAVGAPEGTTPRIQ
jgi:hypothetical protein